MCKEYWCKHHDIYAENECAKGKDGELIIHCFEVDLPLEKEDNKENSGD